MQFQLFGNIAAETF